MLRLLRPALLDGLPGIVAGFTTRHGGVSAAPYDALNLGLSTADADTHVKANRRLLAEAAGFAPEGLVIAGQVHGSAVKVAEAGGLFPGYDALVTVTPGLLLCISAADCATVLLADAAAGVVGGAHAGWRGTVGGVVANTVATMTRLGAEASRMRAYVSPCISAENFEVGPEVAARFDDAYVRHWPGKPKPHVDLKAALAAQLEAAGLRRDAITVSPHCTFGETGDFFSHRGEHGTTGRMMGFIGLRSPD